MSRPKNDIGIKRIEYITKDDAMISKTMMNIMGLCNGRTLKCTFNDHKGGIATRRFNKFHFKDGNKQIDPFCEGLGLIPVRIHYKNGDSELGFKYFDRTYIVTRKNGKLNPYYIKDGYIDDVTGELVCDLDGDTGIPYRILHELPFYNEKVRDMVNSEGTYKIDSYDLNDRIAYLLTADFCVNNANYSIPPNSRNKEKIPWVAKTPHMPIGTKTVHTRAYCYSYWKSMYVDVVKWDTNVYGIIPISDLYTIHREVCGNEVEVWNNLDSTMKGEF